VVVVIERVPDWRFRSVKVGWTAVDEIDIRPSVVVVVEEDATTAAGLWKMVRFRAPVVVSPGDLALCSRHLDESDACFLRLRHETGR
jgi:hypothetical protein